MTLIEELERALKLASHDQLDLLNYCRAYQAETNNFRKKEIRMMRADALRDRLNITEAALKRVKEESDE